MLSRRGAVAGAIAGAASALSAPPPDLPAVVAGLEDGTVRRWLRGGRQPLIIGRHEAGVTALAQLPDGSTAITSASDGSVRCWDTSMFTEAHGWGAHADAVLALAVAPDGRTLATGGADHRIRLWSLPEGKRLSDLEAHADGVTALAFTAAGDLLVSGSADGFIRTWAIEPDGSMQRLAYRINVAAHDAAITGIAVAGPQAIIVTASADGFLKTWMQSGALRDRVRLTHHGLRCIALLGDAVAAGDDDGRLHVCNPLSPAASRTPPVAGSALIAVAGAGDQVIAADAGRGMRLAAAATGAIRAAWTGIDSPVHGVMALRGAA